MKHTYKYTCLGIFVLLMLCMSLFSQEDNQYITLYNNKQYDQALQIINTRLSEIYAQRVDDKQVPTGFITATKVTDNTDYKTLLKMFKNRKAKGFFIEENKEISSLHFYAGRCYLKKMENKLALNHYLQSLRFKKTELKKDDVILYDTAQIYRNEDHFRGYVTALEAAYEINPEKYEYSLELGQALYRTREKKKSVYHLERYITNSDDEFDPKVYLMAGNLYEDLGKYLNTQAYYIKYLEKKGDDGAIHFALGHLAYKRTGNFPLAQKSLVKSLALLGDDEIVKRSKANEYLGDLAYHDLEFADAIAQYSVTITYQQKIMDEISGMEKELAEVTQQINNLKSRLISEPVFEDYQNHELLLDKKGKLEFQINRTKNKFKKLNAGYVHWSVAVCYERLEKYNEAIEFYRKTIFYNYKANQARNRIVKLQLKIKRGY